MQQLQAAQRGELVITSKTEEKDIANKNETVNYVTYPFIFIIVVLKKTCRLKWMK